MAKPTAGRKTVLIIFTAKHFYCERRCSQTARHFGILEMVGQTVV